MAAPTDLVARSGELKQDLLAYARRPRYDRAFRDFLACQDPARLGDEQDMIMLMDHFVLQHRLGNGKTVVEQFVASRGDLGEVDRDRCSAGGTWSRASSRCSAATGRPGSWKT